MNPREETSPTLERSLDRLVDGCLSDTERRALLTRLESEPDGWKRCALAFLEDQAWRAGLAGVVEHGQQSNASAPTRRPRRRPILIRQAIAAGVIALTFAVGFAAGGVTRGPIEVAKVETKPIQAPKTVADRVREVGYFHVVDPSAGEGPPERVPILAGPGLDEQWLRDQPPAVSDYVKAQWERQGYHVEEQRSLVSFQLDDGQLVSIPVDQVKVGYVGRQPL